MPEEPFTQWLVNKRDRLSKFKLFDVRGRGALNRSDLKAAAQSFLWLLPPEKGVDSEDVQCGAGLGWIDSIDKKSTPLLNKARRLGSLQDQLSELEVYIT